MKQIKLGFVDYTTLVFISDPASTDGSGKTGLVAANLTVSYSRVETDNDVTVTDVTSSLNNLAALTTAHTDWGLLEVSSTLAPGLYRLDIADAVFAAGAWTAVVYVMITTSAAAASPMEFVLVAFDPLDTVRLGLTALPNAVPGAAGGVFIAGANAATSITTALTANVTGDITGNLSGSAGSVTGAVGSVGAGGITAASIAADAITAAKIADGAIEANTFAAGAINAAAIAADAITAAKIADGAIDAATFAAGAITAAAIATNAIDDDALAADAVTAIQAGLATAASIAALNNLSAAQVNTEVDTALADINLDHLVKIAVDTDFPTTVHLNSVVGHLADNGTAATFDRTTDSLEALQGVSAPSAATIADAVWDETLADHLGAGSTGAGLNAAGSAGDPWSTALPGAYGAGTAGRLVGENVNATISSRASQASVDTIGNFVDTEVAAILAAVDTEVAAIKAKTDNLPTDPADESSIQGTLTTIAGYIDTEVGAIKAVTDALPNGGALTTIQSDLDDIQARLPAVLVSGRMDSNMQAAANGVITAAVVATDAIDSDALAANAITEIQNGLATAAALATVAGYVDTEIGTLQTDVSAILADTGTDGVVVATASKTGYALSAAGVDEIFDELRAGHSVAGSYGESFFTLESGAAIAGTLSTTQMSTNLTEATDDHYKGRIIIWVSGALLRQATDITAYNGTTKVLTFTALTEAATAADKFVIV